MVAIFKNYVIINMYMKTKLMIGMMVFFGIATASGASGKKGEKKNLDIIRAKQLIERFDKDKDGKLNAEERAAASKARKAEILKRFDKDKDGKLNAEERKVLAKTMKARKGRLSQDKSGKKSKGKKPKGKKPAKNTTNKK